MTSVGKERGSFFPLVWLNVAFVRSTPALSPPFRHFFTGSAAVWLATGKPRPCLPANRPYAELRVLRGGFLGPLIFSVHPLRLLSAWFSIMHFKQQHFFHPFDSYLIPFVSSLIHHLLMTKMSFTSHVFHKAHVMTFTALQLSSHSSLLASNHKLVHGRIMGSERSNTQLPVTTMKSWSKIKLKATWKARGTRSTRGRSDCVLLGLTWHTDKHNKQLRDPCAHQVKVEKLIGSSPPPSPPLTSLLSTLDVRLKKTVNI